MAVLQAPPGAGKTTLVPLDLLSSGLITGRIVMLEPRRLAARAAAERMAELLGEKVGATVGYRMRGEARVGPGARIEVVTEGILTRMIQGDPELTGVGCVIFDEFHERSLNADLGLALCLEVRGAIRHDLVLVVMSATLDAAPVAALMEAPVITSMGRAFPVETRWLARPSDARFEVAMAGLIRAALEEVPKGGLLAFLPGEGEIRRVAAMLTGLEGCTVLPLYGAMAFAAQRAALGPVQGRRVVLATSIAETSLTLPDIAVVVDGGRSRRARFDPNSGMSRLVTERVTKAEAEQRRGRAGRVAAGVCYRMWTKGEEGGMAAFPPAEIEAADLCGLALELALWGSGALAFVTEPPAGPLAEARLLLERLGALAEGRITEHGRALAALPLHPRLAHMLVVAGSDAAVVAALLAERDVLRGEAPDLALRVAAVQEGTGDRTVTERVRVEARRLSRLVPAREARSLGEMAALAYPDRIGLTRGAGGRFLLSGGKGAVVAGPLAQARLIVAVDLDGDAREAVVRQAVGLSEAELRGLYPTEWREVCEWSRREGRVVARRQECFGALVLAERVWDAPAERVAAAAFEGLRDLGLPWTAAARRLRARMGLLGIDVTDAALLAEGGWVLPWLARVRTEADIRAIDLSEALLGMMTWDQKAELDRVVPQNFVTPLGRRVAIEYDGVPSIEVRLQEMFGVAVHPVAGGQPLRVTLLSPGGRPIQVTMDVPGFWRTSYAEVRKDMRGAYPRHPWPEDPLAAEPTVRAKPRGT
jgi:ATP-dependent helicase HrpB